ncbi:MAG: ATP-binding protein [Methylophilaceae bacterium]|nr:ATP-binding protein [Methylophilaceae bacterium]
MTDPGRMLQSPAVKNLHRLFWLRAVVVAFLSSITLLLHHLGIPLPIPAIATAIGGMLVLNIVTWRRLRNPRPIGEAELGIQLLGDIATFTLLFYFTGGYSNPFVWMYLLPLTVAAVALPARYVWLLAGLVVGCYSLLVFFHLPLSHLHANDWQGIGVDTHLAGMWLGFVVSAGVIAFFVERMGRTLREYDRLIAQARERMLESERMLALGTLATAAAHELGTPLATMAVVAGEMRGECADSPQLSKSLQLLQEQIERCKHILTSITASAGQRRVEDGQRLDDFLSGVLDDWRNRRPMTVVDYRLDSQEPAPVITTDRTLGQALVNLLDNAADASPQRILVSARWQAGYLYFDIRDFGPGMSPEIADRAGTPFFSTKEGSGMGLGLYLAKLIFERFGGRVSLMAHPEGGTVTSVQLPLASLLLEAGR